jgi:hypothetical protein
MPRQSRLDAPATSHHVMEVMEGGRENGISGGAGGAGSGCNHVGRTSRGLFGGNARILKVCKLIQKERPPPPGRGCSVRVQAVQPGLFPH